jgi:hypothetical protein
MAKAQNPFAPEWYTPAEDQGKENPTRFKVRGLNGAEMGYVQPEMILDTSGPQAMLSGLTGKGLDLTLKHGLLDWENFDNDSGALKFSPHNFSLIPLTLRTELALKIISMSFVSEEEKKT